ncbi:integrase catalytic domain-containing protein [Trichonephila clavipes]|nr:integrase catalytic domain-containing protein [Trichonephila clavipes]
MKCLLQDLWKEEIQWDDPLSTHIEKEWKNGQVVPELDYLTEHEKETVVQERKILPEADKNGEGIVRVGGRLENGSVPYLHKHPAILPKGSKLSKLYFNSLQTSLFHVGPQGLLNAVRQKFWPLSGRSIARKTVHQCVTCFKSRPILSSQIMGNLPSEREDFGKRYMPGKRARRHFSQFSEFEIDLIIEMKTAGLSTRRVVARWIVRSVPLEIVGSSGHEKVLTRGKLGLERPERPRRERIEGSCGKHLWTPQ